MSNMGNLRVPDPSKWKMNHTMIRVKDPARSIAFYRALGFSLIEKLPMPGSKFDLYFLGFDVQGKSPSAGKLRSDRQGLLELTHNYGTELNETYTVSNGNEAPYLGFQHIGITVDDVGRTITNLPGHSIKVLERSKESQAQRLASDHSRQVIVMDPDGYYVELNSRLGTPISASSTVGYNCFNSTGLRIKDPRMSLPWYSDILGMSILQQVECNGCSMYWLGYLDNDPERQLLEREGMVKLIWIHGTELKEGKVYHNGNDQPQGFGHLALAVDDITAACEYFEAKNVKWKKRLMDGRLKSIAFILDPDEYWIEIIQNARIKEPLGVQ
ncbi:lactoylglutathione lyase [Aspergillus lucknowensis]|uniref:lactoylglutathione lyase n=1 Tax=Aspergillus lucknowensis TaxID=176173 RepID=A0ABR4LD68_9EURO